MPLVVAEKDLHSADLMSFQNANENLKARLWDFDRKLKEYESKCKAVEAKVSHYEFAEYIAKVVDIYWSSPKFEEEFYEKSKAFYDRGCAHLLRQIHQFIPDKALMCMVYESSYANRKFKNGCNLVPFTESELVEIVATDLKKGR